jgi:predicted transcriptional regulator
MATVPFSIRIDEEIKARLDKQAAREERSAGFVVQKAVDRYLNAQAYFEEEIEKAFTEADKGVFISEVAMMKWMESWDTENELPPPEPDVFLGPRKR